MSDPENVKGVDELEWKLGEYRVSVSDSLSTSSSPIEGEGTSAGAIRDDTRTRDLYNEVDEMVS